MIKSTCLALILCAGFAVAQTGTRPDPVAGQSSAQPTGAPTNTPQAQQDASPAQKPQPTQQNNAATQPTQAQPPAPQASQPPANNNGNTSNQENAKPQSDAAPNVAHVELTPAVSGPPETKILDSSAIGKHDGVTGAADPLLDTPPLPKGKPTLIGGTAVKVDRVRNRVTVEPYGDKKKTPIFIDERSHIYRNGVETTIMSIKKGDRVYFDTMLDGAHVFAKNVRVISETGGAEVRGQITAYDAARGVIQLQDALSSRPVSFHVNNQTQVKAQQGRASISDLAKGALVDVMFAPDKANRGIATQITLLARPGTSYTFAGIITNVNVRDAIVSVENHTDGKVYDIQFDPRSRTERAELHVGNSVSINATFDGENYRATNVRVSGTPARQRPDQQQRPNPDDQE
jgi:Domain of unknown function (DUF5666)